MARSRFLDHLAYFFTMFRWILMYIDLVAIPLAIGACVNVRAAITGPLIVNGSFAGITAAALVFNLTVTIADIKVRKRIPGEVEFSIPRHAVITGDVIFAALYLAVWVAAMFPAIDYYTLNLQQIHTMYLRAYTLAAMMVMWHFHLIFAAVGIIRRRMITKIVAARRLGLMSTANRDQD